MSNPKQKKIDRVDSLYPVPWWTKKAIKFLEDFLKKKPDAKVLEFGSGGSTLWLSKLTKHLVSIEHNIEWYDQVGFNLSQGDSVYNPVDLRLLSLPYDTVCQEFADEFFDLIIVDGRNRVRCLEASLRMVKRGGILMLDDAQREYYQRAHFLLQDWDFTRTIDSGRQTHWWQKPLTVQSMTVGWSKALEKSPVRLYAGNLTQRAEQDGWTRISTKKSDKYDIRYDWQKPFPIGDKVVDCFLCEDCFQNIAPEQLLAVVFPEIYRTLKTEGYVRISVPDYRCDVFLERSWKDEQGKPYYDPGARGRWNPEKKQVTHNGTIWFPTYETLKNLIELSPLRYCQANWLHYYNSNGEPVMNKIDYSKGFIKRTPDHDPRVKTPRRPMSIVVDLYKTPLDKVDQNSELHKQQKQILQKATTPASTSDKPNVFVVGLNKSGTTSLYTALKKLGWNPVHNPYVINPAIDRAVKNGNHLLHFLKQYNMFCDIFYPFCGDKKPFTDENSILELHNRQKFFETIDRQYPNSKYICNIRNKEDWLRSRKRHVQNNLIRDYKGKWLTVDEPAWSEEYDVHYELVFKYFQNRKDFYIFNIDETPSYEKICTFLEVPVLNENFPKSNRSINLKNRESISK